MQLLKRGAACCAGALGMLWPVGSEIGGTRRRVSCCSGPTSRPTCRPLFTSLLASLACKVSVAPGSAGFCDDFPEAALPTEEGATRRGPAAQLAPHTTSRPSSLLALLLLLAELLELLKLQRVAKEAHDFALWS